MISVPMRWKELSLIYNVKHGGIALIGVVYKYNVQFTKYCRYILDGWPLTKTHVDLLEKFHLIPICIVELKVSNQEALRRAAVQRCSTTR